MGRPLYFTSPSFFLSSFFPRLISHDGLSANLKCMSEMCCTRLAENTGRKYAKNRHLRTIRTKRRWNMPRNQPFWRCGQSNVVVEVFLGPPCSWQLPRCVFRLKMNGDWMSTMHASTHEWHRFWQPLGCLRGNNIFCVDTSNLILLANALCVRVINF